MELKKISSSLVYLDMAKQVWDKAKEMFSGTGNRGILMIFIRNSLYPLMIWLLRLTMASFWEFVRRLILVILRPPMLLEATTGVYESSSLPL